MNSICVPNAGTIHALQTLPGSSRWLKHESLPTSKLVLWSRNGFTRSAIRKAELLKIDVVSAKDVEKVDWAKTARNLVGSRVQLVSPTFFPFLDVRNPDGTLERIEGMGSFQWFRKNTGELAGTMELVIQEILTSDAIRTVMLDHTPAGSGDFWVHVCSPADEEWFTRAMDGTILAVTRVGIGIRTITESLSLEVASASHAGKVITLATATTSIGNRVDFYVE
ncbi:hypothetical protein [Ottowia sp. VDI28]|uniref:hypothetical protein n=1 Tax=Ottowia sp. VDI28 TaxID=3133968 RepID=UPI003C2CC45B